MHSLNLPEDLRARVTERIGRDHAYDRLDPAKTALVVVDMQNYFVAPGAPAACEHGPAIAPNINRLAETLRDKGGRVYWIQTEALPEDANDWQNLYEMLGDKGKETRLAGLERESGLYEMWPEMDVRDGDETVVKTRYSAMLENSSDLKRRLDDAGVDTVLITGVATNVCCEATARDAMMMGYRVAMVSDANAARYDEDHLAGLTSVWQSFGDVRTTDDCIDNLLA